MNQRKKAEYESVLEDYTRLKQAIVDWEVKYASKHLELDTQLEINHAKEYNYAGHHCRISNLHISRLTIQDLNGRILQLESVEKLTVEQKKEINALNMDIRVTRFEFKLIRCLFSYYVG